MRMKVSKRSRTELRGVVFDVLGCVLVVLALGLMWFPLGVLSAGVVFLLMSHVLDASGGGRDEFAGPNG